MLVVCKGLRVSQILLVYWRNIYLIEYARNKLFVEIKAYAGVELVHRTKSSLFQCIRAIKNQYNSAEIEVTNSGGCRDRMATLYYSHVDGVCLVGCL